MSDRTEALLAELVDLQRQFVANQQIALEQQKVALDQQNVAVAAQRRVQRLVIPLFVVILLIVGAVLLPYGYRWFLYLSAR